jgi:signal peptidase I
MNIISAVFPRIPIRQNSMLPTIHDGDRVLAVPSGFARLNRGSVVIFKDHFGDRSIKRIIGLPGETIKVEFGTLYANMRKVGFVGPFACENFGPVHVPEHTWFLIGDNCNDSIDSRLFGPVHARDILYKALFVYRPLRHFKFLS